MNKKEIEKNRLDLAYKKQLQILSNTMILGTITLVPVFISIILGETPEKRIIGLVIVAAIASIAYINYKNTDNKLKEISNKLKRL